MFTRILTGLILAPLVVVLFLWGPAWLQYIFFQGVAVIGAHETFRLLFPKPWRAEHWLALGVTALLPLGAFLFPDRWPEMLVVAVLVVLIAKLFNPLPIEQANDQTGRLTLALLYGGLLFVFPVLVVTQYGPWIVVIAAATWMGDTGAFFAGKALGRHKLYPVISPKKTVEGSIGGLIGSTLGGWAFSQVFVLAHPEAAAQFPLVHVLAFSAVAGLVEQVGDLVESMFKRSSGIKDSGSLLPGHGGVLDRFDGFLFACPAVYLLLEIIR